MLPAYSEESQSHNSANNYSTDTANSNQEKRADNGASLLLPQLNLTGKTAAIMVDEKSKKTIVLGDCIETSDGYCRYLYTDKNVSIGNQEARKA
jgi:hypothetical protein